MYRHVMGRSVVSRVVASWLLLVGVVVLSGQPAGAQPVAVGGEGDPVVGGACVSPAPHGFSDVPSGSYYDVAVGWLLEAEITSGTGPGKFSPAQSVTRAQMAVFLWRAAGSPVPEGSNGFSDVGAGTYYEQAVIWLVGEGITSGTGPGKYSPLAPVTRAQMAVFLWRAAGSPVPEGSNGFSDVGVGTYYEQAVIWLVGEGITSGTGPGKYSPLAPVTRAQMAVFLWRSACAKAETFTTPALPQGNARFVDALTRDLLGRAPTDIEISGWVGQLDGGLTREQLAADLAGRDEFVGLVVDNAYLTVLDRVPTGPERSAGVTKVRTDQGAQGLLVELLASTEFFAMAGSTDSGFVYTAGQRVLKRDLSAAEAAPFIAGLGDSSKSRADIATGLVGGVEGSRVRAKMWVEKLLSRVPTDPELELWGSQAETAGDLAVVGAIAGGDDYLLITQERIVESTLTTASGTVVVTGDEVVSANYGTDGSGAVVLAAGVVPPSVGQHLVVSNDIDPAAGGVGRVTTLTAGPGNQSTVLVVAAGLADAFASGEMVDTTELINPVIEPAPVGRPSGRAAACEGDFSWGDIRADVGIDTANDSSISWSFNNFDARIAIRVTPRMSVTATGPSISGSCSKDLWNLKWDAPIQAGPVTIPGYFKVGSKLKVSGEASGLDFTGSMSLPCTIGVTATKSSVSNISGCDRMRTSATFKPAVEASAYFSADLNVGYFLGVDKGGWAKANVGMTAGLTAGLDAEARLITNPGWEADAYLDASLDLEGTMLGKWDLDYNLAYKRLKHWSIASGQIGQGTPDGGTYQPGQDSVEPDQPPGPTAGATIAAGNSHTCAVRQDTTVACWGSNYFGQLGDGSPIGYQTPTPTPTPVVGLSGVTAITAGDWHSCALKQDGTVVCWGFNRTGQSGIIAGGEPMTPVAGLSGVISITAGGNHSCAVEQDGTVACWGENWYGQLGNGSKTTWDTPNPTPTPVVGLTGVTALAAGRTYSCAVKQDGTVACWGWNYWDGLDSLTPTPVVGLNGVTAITAGQYHTCARKQDATVECWGVNDVGQVGAGVFTPQQWFPAPVVGLTGATAISAGGRHSCAVEQNARVVCWGEEFNVQPGDEPNIDWSLPRPVIGLTSISSITVGPTHACAVKQNDTVVCWGENDVGQLGDGTTDPRSVPTPVVGL